MKKQVIIWLCILSLILSMTACQKSDQEEDKSNNDQEVEYIEHNMAMPKLGTNEYLFYMNANANNQLEYYTVQSNEDESQIKINSYTWIEGEFKKSSVGWMQEAIKNLDIFPSEFCHGQDGNDYLLYMKTKPTSDDQAQSPSVSYGLIQKKSGSETYQDITPAYWSEEFTSIEGFSGHVIQNLIVTKDQILCYQMDYDGIITFYDNNQKKEINYGEYATFRNYVLKDNTLYYFSEDAKEIIIQQLGKESNEHIPLESVQKTQDLLVTEENHLLLLDNTGIHEWDKDDTKWVTLINAETCSISIPSYSARYFLLDPGTANTYYIYFQDEVSADGDVLMAYLPADQVNDNFKPNITETAQISPEPNSSELTTPEPKDIPKLSGEITIYSMWRNTTMKQAIAKYATIQPQVKINYKVSEAGPESVGATVQDLVRSLNTEILAGNGADIYLLDGLPWQSYIQKGILMDMSDIFFQQLKETKLLKNVADCYINEGKIYCMPMRFYMPLYAMRTDFSEHTDSLADLAAYFETNDQKMMEPLCYEKVVQMFLCSYYNEIYDENGINQEKLSSFLTNLKILATQINATIDGSSGAEANEGGITGANARVRNIYCGDFIYNLLVGDVASAVTFTGDLWDMATLNYCVNKKGGNYYPINHTFLPNGLVGINNTTKEAAIAKDFVAFLFSEEIQYQHLNDGYPINEASLATWINEEVTDTCYTANTYDDNGYPVIFTYEPMSVSDKIVLEPYLRSLQRPVYQDFIGMELILPSAIEYLNGDKTLDQAVSNIVNKTNLYLEE